MARLAILGAGAIGTALSIALHRRERTLRLWTHEADVADTLRRTHENPRYLPGHLISPSVKVTMDLAEALDECEAVLLTVPSSVIREMARRIAPLLPNGASLISVARGFEEGSWLRMTEVIRSELPSDLDSEVLALSGPCLAPELARGGVAAVDIACERIESSRRQRHLLSTPHFRMHPTTDVPGVEATGSLNSAYALGAGIGDGLGWGMNEKATYLSKAVAEIARLAAALGARRSTVFGLSGIGDLSVLSFSMNSRNRKVGEDLARGRSLREAVAATASVTEGVAAGRAAHTIATQHRLRLPIAESLHAILQEGAEPNLIERAIARGR